THPPYLPFCPSSILLLRLHRLLCALRNKIEDKQKFFAIWVGYLFPVALAYSLFCPIAVWKMLIYTYQLRTFTLLLSKIVGNLSSYRIALSSDQND
ncbi:MAG: hypothetical protein V3U88_04225, partial [Methylococcales bacterium]